MIYSEFWLNFLKLSSKMRALKCLKVMIKVLYNIPQNNFNYDLTWQAYFLFQVQWLNCLTRTLKSYTTTEAHNDLTTIKK